MSSRSNFFYTHIYIYIQIYKTPLMEKEFKWQNLRRRTNNIFIPQQRQATDNLISQIILQLGMMQSQKTDQVLWKTSRNLRVAVRHMGDKVYQLAQGDDAGVVGGRGCLEKKLPKGLILIVLLLKIFLVRTVDQASALVSASASSSTMTRMQ